MPSKTAKKSPSKRNFRATGAWISISVQEKHLLMHHSGQRFEMTFLRFSSFINRVFQEACGRYW
jgi:hypothetical protein